MSFTTSLIQAHVDLKACIKKFLYQEIQKKESVFEYKIKKLTVQKMNPKQRPL